MVQKKYKYQELPLPLDFAERMKILRVKIFAAFSSTMLCLSFLISSQLILMYFFCYKGLFTINMCLFVCNSLPIISLLSKTRKEMVRPLNTKTSNHDWILDGVHPNLFLSAIL